MSTPKIIIYLVPLYVVVVVGLINVIAIRLSPTLRSRLHSATTPSTTNASSSSWTSKYLYLVPYPLVLLFLPPDLTVTPDRTHTRTHSSTRVGGEMVQVDLRTPALNPTGFGAGRGRNAAGRGLGLGSRLFGRSVGGAGLTPAPAPAPAPAPGSRGGSSRGSGQGQEADDPLSTLLLRGIGRGSGLNPASSSTNANANGSRSRGRSGTSGSGSGSGSGTAPPRPTTTTTGNPTPAGATATATSGRVITRGGRRWGRTGSQRSTNTLPLYSEDVGEEDVVLIRKRESLRDAGRGEEGDIVEVDREGESDGEGDGELDNSEIEDEDEDDQRSFMTARDDEEDLDHSTPRPTAGRPRATSSVSSVSSSEIPERGWGEAPSYDTAVPPPRFNFDADPERSGPPTSSSQRHSTAGPAPGRGGFRAFVGRLTGGRTETHRRGFGSVSSTSAPGDEDMTAGLMRMSTAGTSTTGRARGWSNASGTGGGYISGQTTPGMASQLSLVSNAGAQPMMMSRYSSRLSSFGAEDGASTSAIPISAPLPGTLIRSSFDAPRKGFSADQVKFLSSTESLGRFGVRVDEDGNPIADDTVAGRRRGSSVGSMARPAELIVPTPQGLGWREMAREEQATVTVEESPLSTTARQDRMPAPLAITRLSGVPGVEIEVVPPTPTQ